MVEAHFHMSRDPLLKEPRNTQTAPIASRLKEKSLNSCSFNSWVVLCPHLWQWAFMHTDRGRARYCCRKRPGKFCRSPNLPTE